MIESKLANIARVLTIFCVAAAAVTQAQTFVYGDLNGQVGAQPISAPVQGLDGSLYGTLPYGGNYPGYGTIYKLTPTGKFSNLYKFCAQSQCPDGEIPQQMVLAANGISTALRLLVGPTRTTAL